MFGKDERGQETKQPWKLIVMLGNVLKRVLIEIGRDFLVCPKFFFMYLGRDIKPPNHKSSFTQFFPQIFLSLSSCKRKQTFTIWSKTGLFSQFVS